MLKRLNKNAALNIFQCTKRTFLSEAYKCTESWNSRLTTPILQKIKLEPLYYELEQRFHQQGKVSAIDIDVFANKITNESFTEELADLVHKLRLTEETSNTLDSTGHALIRLYLDQNNIKELLDILNDRLSYGVFLDNFTANLSLDKLIKAKDFKSAARIASYVMLQEDFTNPITRSLSLYSCWKFLENPQPFEEPKIEPVVQAELPKSKKKSEEVKVRVKFLRNPFFDDHFDLVDSRHLVGKTLQMIGKQMGGSIGNSAQLLGYALYQKYAEGIEFVSKVQEDVYRSAVERAKNILVDTTGQDENEDFKKFSEAVSKLESDKGLLTDDFEKAICTVANDAVAKSEATEIAEQTNIYKEWLNIRQIKMDEELKRLNRARRLANIENITKDMDTQEQKLWFFENEDNIELQIDSKKVFYRKRWFGPKKKPRSVDAGYIPPEVRSNAN